MKTLLAILLALFGIIGSIYLKISGVISEGSLDLLLAGSVLTGLIVGLSDRVVFFSFKDLSVKLAEAKQTEKSIKEISWAMLDVIDKNSGFLALESFDQKALDDAKDKLKRLIA